MARSKAHANRHTRSPLLDDPLGSLELRPDRELATPEAWQAALPGVDGLLSEATARAYHRSQADAQQRAHDRGKKTADVAAHGHGAACQGDSFAWAHLQGAQA